MEGEFWNMGILNPELFQSNSPWLDVVKCLLTIVLLQMFTYGEKTWRIYFHKALINILYHRDALNIFRIKNVLRHSLNEVTKKLHALEIRLTKEKEQHSRTAEKLKINSTVLKEEKIIRKETEQILADVNRKYTKKCELYERVSWKYEEAMAEVVNLKKVKKIYRCKLYDSEQKLGEVTEKNTELRKLYNQERLTCREQAVAEASKIRNLERMHMSKLYENEQRLAQVTKKNTELRKLYDQKCIAHRAQGVNLRKVEKMHRSKMYEFEEKLADAIKENTDLRESYKKECSKREEAVTELESFKKSNRMFRSKLYEQDTKLAEMKDHLESCTRRLETAKNFEEVTLREKQMADKERDTIARNFEDLNDEMVIERRKIKESMSKNDMLLKKYVCLKWKYMCQRILLCSQRGSSLKECIFKNFEKFMRVLNLFPFVWCILVVGLILLLLFIVKR
ncbi:meiosis-specific nuclear structural protein 1-like isoform X2 [Anneissia japonica]|uniref:meiosis-specific nuclear structural protein 1-like isoform X2 n=1 Tax=Anneissia japonica TaxID=1529436 RepID=UPI0014257EF7|nr:meiosis-specific nuclear structural protein 1-like isoform X2 [Anneissia japonica]